MNYIKSVRSRVGKDTILLPGARIIIQNECNEILLHRRRDFIDHWSLPGGSAEIGESIYETICREVEEETGLVVSQAVPIGFASDSETEMFEYPNGDSVHLFAMIFWCCEYTGTMTPDTIEAPELRFFPLDDLPKMRANEVATISHFRKYTENGHFFLQ